jgi:arylsulfatase A-like enzyme
MFKDVVVPRTPNFNPDKASGASWISRLPRQDQENIEFNDHFYRNRLRALQAVDEMIDLLMARLSDADILDSTYIFFSTDNGYSIGQHRRQPGKQCPFEEDINVPFIVRGPGIAEGIETDWVTSHTDLAPTFLSLADIRQPKDVEFDGQAIPLTDAQLQNAERPKHLQSVWSQEHVNVEMWGIIMSEGKYGSVLYPNHTYKALRVVGNDYNLLYTVWCSGEHELYDMLVGLSHLSGV